MASNPLDNLLGQAGAAQDRLERSLQVALLTSVDADGRTGTAQGLDGNWSVRARLWQPRLTETMPHSHEMPASDTSQVSNHKHKVPAQESEEHGLHTHEVEYRVGDRGVLLHLRDGVAIFLGGL